MLFHFKLSRGPGFSEDLSRETYQIDHNWLHLSGKTKIQLAVRDVVTSPSIKTSVLYIGKYLHYVAMTKMNNVYTVQCILYNQNCIVYN